jgi:7,8-dihydropterin-6-yl-methyl-4-(beta-D-ribofuranosyl)aminobenzene 5'-phosphate synthase
MQQGQWGEVLGLLFVGPSVKWGKRGDNMHVVTLMENTVCRDDLACEHGLSLYIEACGKKILFDAGQTGAFADNARKLGVDLAQVDFAVLSHGHYDHGGGLRRFLEINQTAPVYLRREAFGDHYNGTAKYIGLDKALLESGRLVFVPDMLEISPGITLYGGPMELRREIRAFGLTRRENGEFLPEDFRHEQYLLIEEKGKTVCFSGCSHRGVVNIADRFRPDVLIGGFHFQKLTEEGQLLQAAEELLDFGGVYYTGHCTGEAQFAFLKRRMGSRLREIPAGTDFSVI